MFGEGGGTIWGGRGHSLGREGGQFGEGGGIVWGGRGHNLGRHCTFPDDSPSVKKPSAAQAPGVCQHSTHCFYISHQVIAITS